METKRVSESSYSGVNYNKNYAYQTYKRWDAGNRLTVNKLFTGILPLQNTFDTGLVFFYGNGNPYNIVQIPVYFYFNLPVTLTKYRMWNGFASGMLFSMGRCRHQRRHSTRLESARKQRRNHWTTVDSRTGVSSLSVATSRFCSSSPYTEFSISSPAAFKTYKLTVTKGGRNSVNTVCNKSGCTTYYPNFQIGEIQLLGYEDPTTSCSLHGVDTFFPGLTYPNLDVTKRFNFSKAFKFDNNWDGSWWSNDITNGYGYSNTGTSFFGYLDFGTNVKITSYKLRRYNTNVPRRGQYMDQTTTQIGVLWIIDLRDIRATHHTLLIP
jgi:hypothetical protein